MIYVGIEAGRDRCAAAIIDSDGRTLLQTEFANTSLGIERFIGDTVSRLSEREPVSVACWAAGAHWYLLHDMLVGAGLDAKAARPIKTRTNAARAEAQPQAELVTNPAMSRSEKLCRLLRAGLVSEAYVPDEYHRSLRALVGLRIDSVRTVAWCEEMIGAMAGKYNALPPGSGEPGEWLRDVGASDLDLSLLGAYSEQLGAAQRCAASLEDAMRDVSAGDKRVELLTGVPGIDLPAALAILSEVADIRRFEGPEKLVAYARLSPRRGADLDRAGSWMGWPARGGPDLLHRTLIGAAAAAAERSDWLRSVHARVAARKGEKIAAVSVAHRIAQICWYVLTNGEPYREQNAGPA